MVPEPLAGFPPFTYRIHSPSKQIEQVSRILAKVSLVLFTTALLTAAGDAQSKVPGSDGRLALDRDQKDRLERRNAEKPAGTARLHRQVTGAACISIPTNPAPRSLRLYIQNRGEHAYYERYTELGWHDCEPEDVHLYPA